MIDVFDIIAFVVFAVLLVMGVILVVSLGQLPGRIARDRGHPQAAAINVMGSTGVATLGVLWPVALDWAFMKPLAVATPAPTPTAEGRRVRVADEGTEGAVTP
jgi:ABC-type Mn2+/Zn2+ transport system permease subunit